MKLSMKILVGKSAALAVIIGLFATSQTAAQSSGVPIEVIGIKSDSISIYDDALNFKSEIPAKEFLRGRDLSKMPIVVLQRSENGGFVQINDSGNKFWLDVADIMLNQEYESTIKCVRVVRTKVPDSQTAAALGLTPCN